ncbi:MAG: hypothetical protein ACYC46_01020 [Acidobacteriaceae bacterium]
MALEMQLSKLLRLKPSAHWNFGPVLHIGHGGSFAVLLYCNFYFLRGCRAVGKVFHDTETGCRKALPESGMDASAVQAYCTGSRRFGGLETHPPSVIGNQTEGSASDKHQRCGTHWGNEGFAIEGLHQLS